MKFTRPVTELIKERRSVRNYTPAVLGPAVEKQIREILDQHTEGPMGNQIRFQLVHRESASDGNKAKLGTYGFIKGARHFVAGDVQSSEFSNEDYGYLLEKIMLHLLDLGLCTCWLGGTFSRGGWAQVLNSSNGNVIPGITPVGYPAVSMGKRERLVRLGAKSDQRKSWEELFFSGEFNKPLILMEDDQLYSPIEMVRLAPSASNKQPWRIVRSGTGLHFFLYRNQGYGGFAKAVDMQRIDMGIAMAHFELGCKETGFEGGWKIMDHDLQLQEGIEYIVSWDSKSG